MSGSGCSCHRENVPFFRRSGLNPQPTVCALIRDCLGGLSLPRRFHNSTLVLDTWEVNTSSKYAGDVWKPGLIIESVSRSADRRRQMDWEDMGAHRLVFWSWGFKLTSSFLSWIWSDGCHQPNNLLSTTSCESKLIGYRTSKTCRD